MKRKKSNALFVLLAAAISLLVLWAVQRLLVPKYMGMVVEGNLTGEYYKEVPDHDVLILGNCEAYENISPAVLWREFGISSYIRGNANQLMAQSYYLLEDALKYEVPGAAALSVSSMTNFSQDNESYNRMTLDGMRVVPIQVEGRTGHKNGGRAYHRIYIPAFTVPFQMEGAGKRGPYLFLGPGDRIP